jgi:succinyl-CoA synthetase beta subunit
MDAVRSLGGEQWVVKAQVHAGGRGKGGGVRLCDAPVQVQEVAGTLLGSRLVTPQTDAQGLPVQVVLVEKASQIARELYLGVLVDRSRERIVIMASAAGGMDIEHVAATEPEKILKVVVDPVAGLQAYQCRQLGFGLQLAGDQIRDFTKLLLSLYRLFTECDASLVEVNPLIVTAEGSLLALDAKINLDDNALYRQKSLVELRDASQEDPREHAAAQHNLNYVSLDGSIGCMVNGAGLAMATMDLIKLHGGEPANFLDVGGGTTAERVAEAFKLILSDPKVKAILVNIFGGIVRCDLIAEGIVAAVREVGTHLPVVVRLQGTNVEQGRSILDNSGLAIISASDLTDAAQQVVAAANATKD